MSLSGKVAVITGGARGLGLAHARRFVAEGACVVIGDLLDAEGAAAAVELGPDVALCRRCDVTVRPEVEALMDAALDRFGRLDVVVANAGIYRCVPFLDLEAADFRRLMAVNVTGTFLTGQAAARRMAAQARGGVIVNVASVNALVSAGGEAGYSASKAAVEAMTRVMAIALADHGIRVNAVGPGPVRTAMLEASVAATAELGDEIELRTPLRRPAEAEEIAAVVCFLASDDAAYMTGRTLYADGGRLALNYVMPERREVQP